MAKKILSIKESQKQPDSGLRIELFLEESLHREGAINLVAQEKSTGLRSVLLSIPPEAHIVLHPDIPAELGFITERDGRLML